MTSNNAIFHKTCCTCEYERIPEYDPPCCDCCRSLDTRPDLWAPRQSREIKKVESEVKK